VRCLHNPESRSHMGSVCALQCTPLRSTTVLAAVRCFSARHDWFMHAHYGTELLAVLEPLVAPEAASHEWLIGGHTVAYLCRRYLLVRAIRHVLDLISARRCTAGSHGTATGTSATVQVAAESGSIIERRRSGWTI
jgi:hypothetical protein